MQHTLSYTNTLFYLYVQNVKFTLCLLYQKDFDNSVAIRTFMYVFLQVVHCVYRLNIPLLLFLITNMFPRLLFLFYSLVLRYMTQTQLQCRKGQDFITATYDSAQLPRGFITVTQTSWLCFSVFSIPFFTSSFNIFFSPVILNKEWDYFCLHN